MCRHRRATTHPRKRLAFRLHQTMTTTCRSNIHQVLNLAIRTLEVGYEDLFPDYQDDPVAMFALDHLISIRESISPTFIRQDEEGNLVVSDPATDREESEEMIKEALAMMLNRINALEAKINSQ